ncbi:hypothetical protein GF318_03725 [Candidatus Micrarchaeota archaeon]|nr:hypothetical protein [Candidatus Micrarchaeota archaeon]
MARARKRRSGEDLMVERLTSGGRYTEEQAREFVRALDVLMRGRNPVVDSQRMANDLTTLTDRWAGMIENGELNARSVSQLEEDDVGLLFRGVLLERPEVTVDVYEPQPSRRETHRYTVAVGDREFDVELANELPGGGGIRTPRTGRPRELYEMLVSNPEGVIAITEGGNVVDKGEFGSVYRETFRTSPETISISSA